MAKTLSEALGDCEAALARAVHQRDELDRTIQQLESEKRGLKLALERHQRIAGDSVTLTFNTKTTMNGWKRMSRPDAVVSLLREIHKPASAHEIAERLAEHGRSDPPKFVSAALSTLKARGAVTNPIRGKWSLAGAEALQSADDSRSSAGEPSESRGA